MNNVHINEIERATGSDHLSGHYCQGVTTDSLIMLLLRGHSFCLRDLCTKGGTVNQPSKILSL